MSLDRLSNSALLGADSMPPEVAERVMGPPRGKRQVNTPRMFIKEAFRQAFEELGSVKFLVDFAAANDANARVFVSALSRLIPQEITGADGQPLRIVVQTFSNEPTRTFEINKIGQFTDVVEEPEESASVVPATPEHADT